MSDQQQSTTASSGNQAPVEGKGKGKAVDDPQEGMEEDDDESSEESGVEEQVRAH